MPKSTVETKMKYLVANASKSKDRLTKNDIEYLVANTSKLKDNKAAASIKENLIKEKKYVPFDKRVYSTPMEARKAADDEDRLNLKEIRAVQSKGMNHGGEAVVRGAGAAIKGTGFKGVF